MICESREEMRVLLRHYDGRLSDNFCSSGDETLQRLPFGYPTVERRRDNVTAAFRLKFGENIRLAQYQIFHNPPIISSKYMMPDWSVQQHWRHM